MGLDAFGHSDKKNTQWSEGGASTINHCGGCRLVKSWLQSWISGVWKAALVWRGNFLAFKAFQRLLSIGEKIDDKVDEDKPPVSAVVAFDKMLAMQEQVFTSNLKLKAMTWRGSFPTSQRHEARIGAKVLQDFFSLLLMRHIRGCRECLRQWSANVPKKWSEQAAAARRAKAAAALKEAVTVTTLREETVVEDDEGSDSTDHEEWQDDSLIQAKRIKSPPLYVPPLRWPTTPPHEEQKWFEEKFEAPLEEMKWFKVVHPSGVCLRHRPKFSDKNPSVLGPRYGAKVYGSVIVGEDEICFVRIADGFVPTMTPRGSLVLVQCPEEEGSDCGSSMHGSEYMAAFDQEDLSLSAEPDMSHTTSFTTPIITPDMDIAKISEEQRGACCNSGCANPSDGGCVLS